jgi:hypothetical protein
MAVDHHKVKPGANPTIVSYNAASSLVRFVYKNILILPENALAYYNASVVVVNSEFVFQLPTQVELPTTTYLHFLVA